MSQRLCVLFLDNLLVSRVTHKWGNTWSCLETSGMSSRMRSLLCLSCCLTDWLTVCVWARAGMCGNQRYLAEGRSHSRQLWLSYRAYVLFPICLWPDTPLLTVLRLMKSLEFGEFVYIRPFLWRK